MDKLITKHLVLRKAQQNDLDYIWNNIWKDDELAETMLWRTTKTLEEAKARLDRTMRYQAENYGYFICLKDTNEPIGFAGIKEREKDIYDESGICIARKCQGMGYAKEVVLALKKLIFEELNGKEFIYGCFSTNEKSRRVCLSQGFRYLNSENTIREYDQKEFIIDYYYFDSDMYKTETAI